MLKSQSGTSVWRHRFQSIFLNRDKFFLQLRSFIFEKPIGISFVASCYSRMDDNSSFYEPSSALWATTELICQCIFPVFKPRWCREIAQNLPSSVFGCISTQFSTFLVRNLLGLSKYHEYSSNHAKLVRRMSRWCVATRLFILRPCLLAKPVLMLREAFLVLHKGNLLVQLKLFFFSVSL